uniref:Uncharacterized protein n=1 Tax=Neogobius melanostomus TaxID=47308 RepID=A0A8C6SAJ7_9GOBI
MTIGEGGNVDRSVNRELCPLTQLPLHHNSPIQRLSSVAFDELNPFSRRAVRSRRALHLERLQRELCDLRRQQSEFLSLRRKSAEEESAGGDQEEALDNSEED